jgi:hypothetical protein
VGFLAQMFVRITEPSITSKLSTGEENPPLANVLLRAGVLVYGSIIIFCVTIS